MPASRLATTSRQARIRTRTLSSRSSGIRVEEAVKLVACTESGRRATKTWLPIVVDVEGYKQGRSEKLQALAWRLAEQVKDGSKPFTLEPMPAYERRVIHLALAEHPDVTTESVGLGEARKVVIRPK